MVKNSTDYLLKFLCPRSKPRRFLKPTRFNSTMPRSRLTCRNQVSYIVHRTSRSKPRRFLKPTRFRWNSRFCYILLLLAACQRSPNTLFTEQSASRTGIKFRNLLKESPDLNVLNYQYFYNGSGVAIGDLDNDGLPELCFAGNMVKNRLYRNKGDFKFEDITEQSTIAAQEGWCTGVTMADVNADGWLDIYICRSADGLAAKRRNLLYINNKNLKFTESAAEYGLADEGYSTQSAFFDMDRDGDLDMFLLNHSTNEYAGFNRETFNLKKQKSALYGSKLYRNQGDNRFVDVTDSAGITSNVLSFGLGVAIMDANNDGWPDIYVSNDFNEEDYLFVNQQNGTFREQVRDYFDCVSLFSMGSDAADFNNDGLTDLVTLDMLPEGHTEQKMHSGAENYDKVQLLFQNGFHYQYSRNMLHLNSRKYRDERIEMRDESREMRDESVEMSASATQNPKLKTQNPQLKTQNSKPATQNSKLPFYEIGQIAGISNTDWSWSALAADYDNDGWKDLFITNGYVKDYTNMDFLKFSTELAAQSGQSADQSSLVKALLAKMPGSKTENYMFQNVAPATGLAADWPHQFVQKTRDWGLGGQGFSSGAAYGDLDNDGDLDLVVSKINEPAGVYRNNGNQLLKRNFLKIKLKGNGANPGALGASVQIHTGANRQTQHLTSSRGYASAVEPVLLFGLGNQTNVDSIAVQWPDGQREIFPDAAANQTLTLVQGKGRAGMGKGTEISPIFQSIDGITARHVENEVQDFKIQSLLPHFLSRSGPCMAKGDADGDGREDLYIGGAKGSAGQLWIQRNAGQFQPQAVQAFAAADAHEDGDAAFFDADGDRDLDLYVASTGYELPMGDPLLQDRLYLNDGRGQFSRSYTALPTENHADGCVAAADADKDGDIDLFIGGYAVPGRYPLTPPSRLLLNDGKGRFTDATARMAGLPPSGMVRDAIWADIDRDGRLDLVVAGEWMPLTVLFQKNERWETDLAWSNPATSGWWNCLTAADFDGDGDTDFAAGNLGLNSQIKASPEQPVTLHYADFDRNGSIDPLLCYYVGGVSYPAASRDDLLEQLVFLKKKYTDYAAYANAKLTDIFTAAQLKESVTLTVANLSSVYVENTGKGFTIRPLPVQAQYAPIYTLTAADVNGDGHIDLVAAGNNTHTRVKFGRYHNHYGLVMLGDGKGGFRALSAAESGLNLRGEVRSALYIGDNWFFGVNNNLVVQFRR